MFCEATVPQRLYSRPKLQCMLICFSAVNLSDFDCSPRLDSDDDLPGISRFVPLEFLVALTDVCYRISEPLFSKRKEKAKAFSVSPVSAL